MRAIDVVVGLVVGGLVAAVVAVNVVIFSGIDEGYEASPTDVFEQSALVGVLVVAVLVAGPVLGVLALRALRRRG